MLHAKGHINENKGNIQIVGHSNVDWVRSSNDRRSILGYCVLVGDNLILWKNTEKKMLLQDQVQKHIIGQWP